MIQIIDFGAGNIQSVKNALKQLGQDYCVVEKATDLKNEGKVVFPGVGAAGAAMENLRNSGFDEAVRALTVPFLGICLGMQLLFEFSEEDECECLGVIGGRIKRFYGDVKIPQIGWNKVSISSSDVLFDGIEDYSYFYFVNSYFGKCDDGCEIASTNYGVNFSSIVRKDNFYGTQFHPEKSGDIGMKLLNNFCELCS